MGTLAWMLGYVLEFRIAESLRNNQIRRETAAKPDWQGAKQEKFGRIASYVTAFFLFSNAASRELAAVVAEFDYFSRSDFSVLGFISCEPLIRPAHSDSPSAMAMRQDARSYFLGCSAISIGEFASTNRKMIVGESLTEESRYSGQTQISHPSGKSLMATASTRIGKSLSLNASLSA